MARGSAWILTWVFIIIDFATQTYDDINNNNKKTTFLIWMIGFCVLNGIVTIYDIVKFIQWLQGNRDEIYDTGFFEEGKNQSTNNGTNEV